jgi:hypothetical protein
MLAPFLISLAVLVLCAWLFDTYILPLFSSKLVKWIVGIIAVLIVIWLLQRFISF